MLKPFIRPLLHSALFFSLALNVNAGEDDFRLPIKVDADTQFVDGKNKLSTLKGNVIITQGSLVIKADEVEVDASAGEGNQIFIARGNPASYSQTLDDDQQVQAQANELRYEVNLRTISLSGNAELVRDTSSVSGNSIVYDMINEQLIAQGNKSENGRVTTVFQPEMIEKMTDKPDSEKNEKNDEQQKP